VDLKLPQGSRIALTTDQSMHILETHASLSAAGSSLYLSFFLAFSLSFRILAVVAQQVLAVVHTVIPVHFLYLEYTLYAILNYTLYG
jgi:hypothetical protein